MTAVTYKFGEDCFALRLLGHANYAKSGKDIVCAAVSTLAYTLIYAFEGRSGVTLQYQFFSGDARVYVRWDKKMEEVCRTVIDTVIGGFELLSHKYPKYVSIAA